MKMKTKEICRFIIFYLVLWLIFGWVSLGISFGWVYAIELFITSGITDGFYFLVIKYWFIIGLPFSMAAGHFYVVSKSSQLSKGGYENGK